MGFRDELETQAAQKYEEYVRGAEQITRLVRELDAIKRYLDRMAPLMIEEGLTPPALEPLGVTIENEAQRQGSGFAVPGNRSSDMPARRDRFVNASQTSAVETLLNESRRLMSADELVGLIWAAKTKQERFKAKHSLVSTLSQGVKSGLWLRPQPGRFLALPDNLDDVGGVLESYSQRELSHSSANNGG